MHEHCSHDHSRSGEVFSAIFTAARQLKRLAHRSAADHELTVHQLEILSLVSASPGLSQKEVAERLRLSKSRVSLHLDQLTEKGLVLRESSPVDRRETVLQPTPRGSESAASIRDRDLSRQALSDVLSRMDDGDIDTLIRLLGQIREGLAVEEHARQQGDASCPE
ncbi:MarR family transcriptional regulator [Paenibacillus spiritus]|uniref:MarR family transcriptional regulator n=1 Tax=Paenibacillus spiritus TaxID=2496557 RepID=A0A5J5GEI0_9BACL|nr:MarR family transcriptional regulator [Paenibacillus spiritus]KAA9006565.1 MarR family transcriptional regulator [Paenibacillus spiritus]